MLITDYYTPPAEPVKNPKLGLVKSKERPKILLDDFIDHTKATVSPPQGVHRSLKNLTWPMFCNGPDSTYRGNPYLAEYGCGNCVPVTILKSIMHEHDEAGTGVPAFTANNAVGLYSELTGFNQSQTDAQGNNPTDQGTDPVAAYNYWKTNGVRLPGGGVDKIAGYAEVSVSNVTAWEIAIWELDIISASINLPITAQTQTTWSVTDPSLQGNAAPGSWGGHEVPFMSYDGKQVALYTWGAVYLATYTFLQAYCDLLLVPLSQDLLKKTGVSETGLNWSGLNEVLKTI